MDNLPSSTAQENELIAPVPSVQTLPQSIPAHPIPESPKQNYLIMAIVVLGILFVGMGGLAIYFWQKTEIVQPIVLDASPTTAASPTLALVADEMANWKTFTKDNYQVNYPSDWSVKSIAYGFSVNKGEYEINFTTSNPAIGPGMCIFSDSPHFNNPYTDNPILAGSKCPEKYIEILGSGFIFRRMENPQTTPEGELTGSWGIYVKDKEGNFVTVPPIQYGIPVPNYNQSEVELMDQILSTFKFTDQTQGNITNWLEYKNSSWGFEFKLPQTWKDYLVSEHNWISRPTREYTADICLYFKRLDSIPACILQISVFSSDEWQTLTKKGGALPKLLGESNQFYFTSNEYNSHCVQLDSFQCDRSKELLEILPTFKFTK